MTGNVLPQLTKWQAIQAAMLYDFTSLDFLHFLHALIDGLPEAPADPLRPAPKGRRRRVHMPDPIWGNRAIAENWAKNGWPMHEPLRIGIGSGIKAREAHRYMGTGVYETMRYIEAFSLDSVTTDENGTFNQAMNVISHAASCTDDILAEDDRSRVNDFNLHRRFPLLAFRHKRIPRFKLKMDVTASTGQVPPVTGVYVASDDPNASLQFAFTEGIGRKLRAANTFNEIGLAALDFVGRKDLWGNDAKMFAFATSPPYASMFHDDIHIDGQPYEDLAPSAVARAAFTTRPATWHLVEAVEGLYDELGDVE